MAKTIMSAPSWLVGTPGSGIRTLPTTPTWGQTLGGATGAGLAGLLDQLSAEKAEDLKKSRVAPLFEKEFGPKAAKAYSWAPPQVQVQGLKMAEEARRAREYDELQGGQGEESFDREPQQSPMELPIIDLPQPDYNRQSTELTRPESIPEPQEKPLPLPSGMKVKDAEMHKILRNAYSKGPEVYGRTVMEYRKIQQREDQANRKEAYQREKLEEASKDKSFDRHKKLIDDTVTGHNKRRGLKLAAEEMVDLVKKGQLASPIGKQVVDSLFGLVGIKDTSAFWSGDSQAFQGLIKDFLGKAKELFGAKPTEWEVRQLLAALPDLAKSDEGKMRILDKMLYLFDVDDTQYDSMMDLLDKYPDKLPRNFDALVHKDSERRFENLQKRWKRSGEERPVEEEKEKSVSPSQFEFAGEPPAIPPSEGGGEPLSEMGTTTDTQAAPYSETQTPAFEKAMGTIGEYVPGFRTVASGIAKSFGVVDAIKDLSSGLQKASVDGIKDFYRSNGASEDELKMIDENGPKMKGLAHYLPNAVETAFKFLPEDWQKSKGFADEAVQDTIAALPYLATLGGPAATLKASMAIKMAGSMAKQAIRGLGGSPNQQMGAEFLTEMGLGLLSGKLSPKAMREFAEQQETVAYKKADNALSPFEIAETPQLDNIVQISEKVADMTEGHKFGEQLKKQLNNIKKYIFSVLGKEKPSYAKVKDLTDLKRANNRLVRSFDTDHPVRGDLKSINAMIDKDLEVYAQQNPEWWKLYQKANEIHGGIEETKKAAELLMDNASGLVKEFFGVLHNWTIGLGKKAYKSYSVPYNLLPQETASYVSDAINSAIRGDKGGMLHNLRTLNEAALKGKVKPIESRYEKFKKQK